MDNGLAAVVAAGIAAVVSIISVIINVAAIQKRNRLEGITAYRMQWIENLRNEYSKILSWNYYSQRDDGTITINSINCLRESVEKVALLLNVSDDYDNKILKLTYEYLNKLELVNTSLNLANLISNDTSDFFLIISSNAYYKEALELKPELQKLVRIYLKTEWTRVKFETLFLKNKLSEFKKNRSFSSEKAIEKFTKEYKGLENRNDL